jgi:hypothetical protein
MLIVALIMMIILPIASVLAIPVLIDALVIVGLIKVFGNRKKKEEKSK